MTLVHVPRAYEDAEHTAPNAIDGRTVRSAQRAAIAQRRLEVAVLLLSKIPQREIARRLNVGLGTVGDDVKAIKESWAERAAEVFAAHVAEEVAKLDWLERAFVPGALSGDHKAAELQLKIMDRRARLLGLDKPQKIEHSGTIEVEAKLARGMELVEEARRLRAV